VEIGRTFRVCLIGSFPSEEGSYANVGELLARRFRADGHRVITASRRRSGPWKLLDMIGTVILRQGQYDIMMVEVFSTTAIWYARITIPLARLLGKRVVGVLHGGGLPRLARARPRWLRGLLGAAHVVASPSDYLRREVGERLRLNVSVIPNPVDLEFFPRRVRTRIRPRLFWLRAFHDVYLPDVAIRVVALLREKYPDVLLTMAGPPKDASWDRCRALVQSLGLEDAVRFPGLINKRQIGEIGDASDIFLNTSSIDNAPLSLVEALAMGLCVVSTDVGGVPALVENGKDALLVPPGSPEATAAAVSRLLEEPPLAESLSRNALATVARFDIGQVASRWYDLFRELSGARGAVQASDAATGKAGPSSGA